PPSSVAGTLSGRIRVPLPVWVDPHVPGLTGPVVPEPITKRRVYRTAGSTSGTAGEALFVHEIPNNVDVEWIDDLGDDRRGAPLLTDLRVKSRHSVDRDGTQPAAGFASMHGHLLQSSYEEDLGGTPQYRGTDYGIDLTATPPSADISYTTRPQAGRPRV